MAYLFDTDAISEVLRRRPAPAYLEWLAAIPREDQFVSAVSIGELFRGAYRSAMRERHLENIHERVLPAVTTLPFDANVVRVFGRVSAQLEGIGQRLADADVQIAATALHFDLELITGNMRHFERISDLRLGRVFIEARNKNQ